MNMADNGLSSDGLSPDEVSPSAGTPQSERRAFLKKAALVGLPVAIMTVRPRTAWAQAQGDSCGNSLGPSGCRQRNQGQFGAF